MNGCASFAMAMSVIVIIAGFMGYSIMGLPAIPVGIALFLASYLIGWFLSPERAAGKINKKLSSENAEKFIDKR